MQAWPPDRLECILAYFKKMPIETRSTKNMPMCTAFECLFFDLHTIHSFSDFASNIVVFKRKITSSYMLELTVQTKAFSPR